MSLTYLIRLLTSIFHMGGFLLKARCFPYLIRQLRQTLDTKEPQKLRAMKSKLSGSRKRTHQPWGLSKEIDISGKDKASLRGCLLWPRPWVSARSKSASRERRPLVYFTCRGNKERGPGSRTGRVKLWMNREPVVQSKVSLKEKKKIIKTYMWNLERWY